MKNKLEQVSIRMVEAPPLFSDVKIDSPEAAIRVLAGELNGYDREVVCIVNLQSDMRPINFNIVSIGMINSVCVSVKDIMKSAILSNAANVILIHNHPSGNLIPSHDDIRITDALQRTCELLSIPLLDHVIIGGGNNKTYYSFREKKLMNFSSIRFAENVNEINFKSAERKKQYARELY